MRARCGESTCTRRASLRRTELADTPVALTRPAKYGIGGFTWSPDGTRIAFEGETRDSKQHEGDAKRREGIYILTIAARTAALVTTAAGPYRNPIWSPDGASIAFETAGGDPNYYYANWYIARIPAAGGAIEPLTKAFDENADLFAWTPRGIYFGAFQRTASHMFAARPGYQSDPGHHGTGGFGEFTVFGFRGRVALRLAQGLFLGSG